MGKANLMLSIDTEVKEAAMARWRGEISERVENYLRHSLNVPDKLDEEKLSKEQSEMYEEYIELLRSAKSLKEKIDNYKQARYKDRFGEGVNVIEDWEVKEDV